MLFEEIDITFFKHLGLLASIILGLTVFKVVSCKPFKDEGEDFNWKKLVVGLAGNALVAIAISMVYSAGSLWGEDLIVVQFGETQVTIQYALDLMLLTAIGTYGVKMIRNFASMLGISKEITPIDPNPQTTFNTDNIVITDDRDSIYTEEGVG